MGNWIYVAVKAPSGESARFLVDEEWRVGNLIVDLADHFKLESFRPLLLSHMLHNYGSSFDMDKTLAECEIGNEEWLVLSYSTDGIDMNESVNLIHADKTVKASKTVQTSKTVQASKTVTDNSLDEKGRMKGYCDKVIVIPGMLQSTYEFNLQWSGLTLIHKLQSAHNLDSEVGFSLLKDNGEFVDVLKSLADNQVEECAYLTLLYGGYNRYAKRDLMNLGDDERIAEYASQYQGKHRIKALMTDDDLIERVESGLSKTEQPSPDTVGVIGRTFIESWRIMHRLIEKGGFAKEHLTLLNSLSDATSAMYGNKFLFPDIAQQEKIRKSTGATSAESN